jgi:hypothetical protein
MDRPRTGRPRLAGTEVPDITALASPAGRASQTHHRPFGSKDLFAERAVGITVGLRVPHELPGAAAGLRDFAARVEATGVGRLFVTVQTAVYLRTALRKENR